MGVKMREHNVAIETVFPLIIECCRSHPDSGEIRRLAASCADWDLLTETASRHKVFCLVHWNLNHACPDLMPARVHD